MKNLFVVLAMAIVLCASVGNAQSNVDKVYFDAQFNTLQKSITEVKGDTSQIISILGNVFEGAVPQGGTLTSLCNKNGWNLVVLMGHNNIVDPDTVKAGAKFSYPKTVREFREALQKGKPLYKAWLNRQKTTFAVSRIKVDSVDINRLNAKVVNISEQLKIKNMEVDKLQIRLAEVSEKLRVKEMEVNSLRVKNAEIDHLRVRLAEIEELRIRELAIKNALIKKLWIKDLQINNQQRQISDLKNKPPVIVEKEVVTYRDAGKQPVARGTCKDDPWTATGIWADFPDGAVGAEIQAHKSGQIKFKKIVRKGGWIYVTHCFKGAEVKTLQELGSIWGENFSVFKDFNPAGDGGDHNTLLIGIAR